MQVLTKQEKERNKRKDLEKLREARDKRGMMWYENDVKDLDMNQTKRLISALRDVKKKLASEISSQYSQINVSHNYLGERSGNIEVGIDLFDQRRMLDLNAFTYNPNMIFPNYRSSFGSYNNGNYMSSYNFNQN